MDRSCKVFVLSGPTAAGKTGIALQLAEETGAHIVSADAMTVYRGLDVGTAKPSAELLDQYPHSCVDVRNLDEEFSVAEFCTAFDHACRDHERVLVVGGTPFYLAALVRPMADLPSANPEIRQRLEETGNLHAQLAEVDPLSAERLHPNDRVRLIRALEVYEITGVPLSLLHERGPQREPLAAPMAWLDHPDLRSRIDQRLDVMLQEGYLREATRIRAEGWPTSSKPLRSFAYRYMLQHLAGEMPLDEAVRCTKRDTWRFARKQRTWARGMKWSAITTDGALRLGREALG